MKEKFQTLSAALGVTGPESRETLVYGMLTETDFLKSYGSYARLLKKFCAGCFGTTAWENTKTNRHLTTNVVSYHISGKDEVESAEENENEISTACAIFCFLGTQECTNNESKRIS